MDAYSSVDIDELLCNKPYNTEEQEPIEHEVYSSSDPFAILLNQNRKWFKQFAQVSESPHVPDSALQENSVWLNAHFQKLRILTVPQSHQGEWKQ